ncbi:hypothetical protein [Streptomyces sp. NPDC007904]|uniref:hypothetical protein n=1 Tax=Streptomyces sp. NPDC007904 TaxID=3364787 RepID=UPI0036EDA7E4
MNEPGSARLLLLHFPKRVQLREIHLAGEGGRRLARLITSGRWGDGRPSLLPRLRRLTR